MKSSTEMVPLENMPSGGGGEVHDDNTVEDAEEEDDADAEAEDAEERGVWGWEVNFV